MTNKTCCRRVDWWKGAAVCGLAIAAGLARPMTLAAEPSAAQIFDESAGATLFAFDRQAIPFSQNVRLEMRSPVKHPANPVVPRGQPGSPDSWAVQFYGSVIREGSKFRMWYVAAGEDRLEGRGPRSAKGHTFAERKTTLIVLQRLTPHHSTR
jgi:hypothetical protein